MTCGDSSSSPKTCSNLRMRALLRFDDDRQSLAFSRGYLAISYGGENGGKRSAASWAVCKRQVDQPLFPRWIDPFQAEAEGLRIASQGLFDGFATDRATFPFH